MERIKQDGNVVTSEIILKSVIAPYQRVARCQVHSCKIFIYFSSLISSSLTIEKNIYDLMT